MALVTPAGPAGLGSGLGQGVLEALLQACAVGVAGSLLADRWWRRLIMGLGFPLSLALSGAVSLSPWHWLLPLALLLLIYPLNAWRDAPLFPTPRRPGRPEPVRALARRRAGAESLAPGW